MENLRRFQSCVVHATIIAGGIITLALMPMSDGEGERIVAEHVDKIGCVLGFDGAGDTGTQVIFVDFIPHGEESLHKSFKSRNLDRLDAWHLLEMAVEPDWEGKGFCSLLMKDGKEIYLHYGFEIDGKHAFGKGQVDGARHRVKAAEATGYPGWVMTKWEACIESMLKDEDLEYAGLLVDAENFGAKFVDRALTERKCRRI
ncbi:hypothetical protein IW262DRAFT_1466479 [Armillaria fumosa]|nr:hypothetical protein IW262DRAFT_1466479 [Armillaria fumosa]